MRNLLIIMVSVAALAPLPAKAEGEMRRLGHWLGLHPERGAWSDTTRFNPYLENGTAPHPASRADEGWTPSEWIGQKSDGQALVKGFYRADILRGQHEDNGTPVVTVGPNFYRLGARDKTRVLASVDAVYGIGGGKAMLVRDWATRRDVGVFTQSGFMMQ